MSLNQLLKPVLSMPLEFHSSNEVELLQDLPVETIYLALKEADGETALWLLENAQPNQIQGILDLDCWEGSDFKPERALLFFENLALLEPQKLFEYMRELDPEFVVRSLMELVEVQDFDPQNPPDTGEANSMISPDNRYIMIFRQADPQHQEALYQWLNKLSSMSLDLMRRHLESCKWEQKSDLEEFAYQIKKGRLEDLGFVDYFEAIQLYSVGRASDTKERLLASPLERSQKLDNRPLSATDDEERLAAREELESWLPKPIKSAILGSGYLADCLALIESQALKEVLLQEILRSVNTALSADRVLHQDLDKIRASSERARRYIDLGLSYLSDTNREKGALLLEQQAISDIHRLGWLCVQDLCIGAKALTKKSPAEFFPEPDRRFLEALSGRHPELEARDLKDLGVESSSLVELKTLIAAGIRLAKLSTMQRFFTEDLGKTLAWESVPMRSGEGALARLMTGLLRQSSQANAGAAFDVKPVTEAEWLELAKAFDENLLMKAVQLILDRAPESLRDLLHVRMLESLEDLRFLVKNSAQKRPDSRFARTLSLE